MPSFPPQALAEGPASHLLLGSHSITSQVCCCPSRPQAPLIPLLSAPSRPCAPWLLLPPSRVGADEEAAGSHGDGRTVSCGQLGPQGFPQCVQLIFQTSSPWQPLPGASRATQRLGLNPQGGPWGPQAAVPLSCGHPSLLAGHPREGFLWAWFYPFWPLFSFKRVVLLACVYLFYN